MTNPWQYHRAMTTWRVEWPDGTTTVGRSGTEIILKVAHVQWPQPDGSRLTHQGMKDQLSQRAQNVCEKFIHPYQPDEPFLRELHRVGLFELTVTDDDDEN